MTAILSTHRFQRAGFGDYSLLSIYAIFNAPRFSPVALYAIAEAFTKGASIKAVGGALLKAAQTEAGRLAKRFRIAGEQGAWSSVNAARSISGQKEERVEKRVDSG